jgi:hypothetical protein
MLSIAHKFLAQQKSLLEVGRLTAPNEDRPEEDEGAKRPLPAGISQCLLESVWAMM